MTAINDIFLPLRDAYMDVYITAMHLGLWKDQLYISPHLPRRNVQPKNISEWGLRMLTHAHDGRRAIRDPPP